MGVGIRMMVFKTGCMVIAIFALLFALIVNYPTSTVEENVKKWLAWFAYLSVAVFIISLFF